MWLWGVRICLHWEVESKMITEVMREKPKPDDGKLSRAVKTTLWTFECNAFWITPIKLTSYIYVYIGYICMYIHIYIYIILGETFYDTKTKLGNLKLHIQYSFTFHLLKGRVKIEKVMMVSEHKNIFSAIPSDKVFTLRRRSAAGTFYFCSLAWSAKIRK